MKKLVAYFSASGTTKKVANDLADVLVADKFEIVPAKAYTSADLNWMDKKSRSSVEMDDPSSRPEVKSRLENMDEYDVVFLGFPIWWYTAPRIINTFLEAYDFAGKTIVLFATSGSSGLGNTAKDLQNSCDKTTKIISWRTLNGHPSKDQLKTLAEGLKL